jgi:hypothetical protein
MNIGIEFFLSLLTTALGVGVAYATLKVKIETLEKSNVDKEYVLQLHKESIEEQKQLAERINHERTIREETQRNIVEHGVRLARLEEAMESIKKSITSIDAKLDRLLLK